VEPRPDYWLLVTFSNNEKRLFDVKPYLDFKPFNELRNTTLFDTVKPAGLSVEWLHGQDICPDELYYNSLPAVTAEQKTAPEPPETPPVTVARRPFAV
jgi:hypothetical protein